MAKKEFRKNNPLEKLSANAHQDIALKEEADIGAESKQDGPPVKQKRKVGRPKTKDIKNTCKNINVAVPITLLNKWEDIKIVHGNNLTEYITKLIKKDMDTNYEQYKSISDSLKNI